MAPDVSPIPAAPAAQQPKQMTLPAQIITQADISRLIRETALINDFFTQASLQAANAKNVPQTSLHLGAIVEENGLNLLQKQDRDVIAKFLSEVRSKAPVVHASFATDPKADFLIRLVAWFRLEAHPHVLLHIGLQPNIAAGCIIRTTNKYFDFSFQQHFKNSKLKLIAAMRAQS